ncbi:hypothetical protein Q9L58_004493 [Maublancomyces gigas]|uniref:Uncharacterized protein n=1 Tax=Discina gigas TaxID=1032678 RepID=A0ABR3GKT6_9PEZI
MSRLHAAISLHATTLRIRVRVRPNASHTRVVNVLDSRVDVAVTEVARGGAANRGVVGFMCKVLGFKKGAVAIVTGGKARDKVLAVEGVEEVEEVVERAVERLKEACEEGKGMNT